MKRQRGRGRKPGNPGNRSLESNGPDVKIRGSASQIYEKYMHYARDAQTAGDRIRAENLYQHAEHYYRIMAANMPKERPPQQNEEVSDDADANEEALNNASQEDSNSNPLEVVDAGDDDSNESEVAADADDNTEDEAPKKRRRPRRKPVEKEASADTEARSALDALAEQQAAIAPN